MNNELVEEMNKLVAKLEEIKKNISNNYSNFLGFNAPIRDLTEDMIKKEQEKLKMYISDIDKTISKLNKSQKKSKSDKISEDINGYNQAKEAYSYAYKANEFHLLPETEPFKKKYKSIESLLYTIKHVVYVIEFGTTDKYKTYNNVFKNITGSEGKLPEIVDLIINDFTRKKECDNLEEEVSKILETPENTPKIIVRKPQQNDPTN